MYDGVYYRKILCRRKYNIYNKGKKKTDKQTVEKRKKIYKIKLTVYKTLYLE